MRIFLLALILCCFLCHVFKHKINLVTPIKQKQESAYNDITISKTTYLNKLFTNGSDQYQDSKMNCNQYYIIVEELKTLLNAKFSINQINSINHIYLINWEDLNDNIGGMTSTLTINNRNVNNTIFLPILNKKYKYSLIHEVWHCIHNNYTSVFKSRYNEWNSIDEYVSDYAETNIDEDIAETGSVFIIYPESFEPDNKKISIIRDIYRKTY